MNKKELFELIKKKRSFLCIGLDTDITKLPKHLLKTEDPVFEFNKQIIDATKDYAVSYKPNSAFYESLGVKGWIALEKTIKYLKQNTDCFTIIDAKRGDIGNTAKMYAKAFLEEMDFDAITVAPYMGEDSVKPFLEFKNKWAIVLALTSNSGVIDFQLLQTQLNGEKIFEKVLIRSQMWGTTDNLMFVVGATQASMLTQVRKLVPDHFLLVPGVGAQGGSLAEVAKCGMNKSCGLLINSSRGIIYADSSEKFAERAGEEAKKLQLEMDELLNKYL